MWLALILAEKNEPYAASSRLVEVTVKIPWSSLALGAGRFIRAEGVTLRKARVAE
jgi:hypothetical protein